MNACALNPIVDGKPSKFYTELLDTIKDRKLVNFLYALSLQPEIKSLFATPDLNSQGEPKVDDFAEKVNLKSIIDDAKLIGVEAQEAGFIDARGNPNYEEDPANLVQSVYDFNDKHENLKATIRYSEDGYFVEVDTINAYNFNSSNVLKKRELIFSKVNQMFKDAGLDVDLSPESAKMFNIVNVKHMLQNFVSWKNNTSNLSETLGNFFIDIMGDNPLAERIFQEFGEDTGKAISQVSGWNYGNNSLNIDAHQQELITNFLAAVRGTLKTVFNQSKVDAMLAEVDNEVASTSTYMGTDGFEVQHVLNDLYRTYNLDQDAMDALQKNVTKISDAAKKLFQIRLSRYDEAKLKGIENPTVKNQLLKTQKELNNSKYIQSIVRMLQDVNKEIKSIDSRLKLLDKKLARNPDALQVIEEYAAFINKQLDLIYSFKPVLEELQSAEILDNDDETGMSSLIDSIKALSGEMVTTLTKINTIARKKQIEVVTAFLKLSWGEDTEEARKARGSDTTLDQIMQTATKDIGFMDRFIYAVNTCSDEMMALIADSVKKQKQERDKALIPELAAIQSATEELFKAGKDTKCVFELDENGYPKRLKSNHDYEKYEADMKAYRKSLEEDPDIKKWEIEDKMNEWRNKHTRTVKEFGIQLTVPYRKENGVDIYATKQTVKEQLSPEEYKYYELMMQKKADMLNQIEAANNNSLYEVIELATDVTTAISESGGDMTKVFGIVKNKVLDIFKQREDDTEYGNAILESNGIIPTHVDAQGNAIMTLPLFYTHKIEDRSRVSTDFSRSMMAYIAASTEYIKMNEITDSLMLAKDYLMQRKVAQTQGSSTLASVSKFGKQLYTNVAAKAGANTSLGGLADDFYERCFYGRSKKDEGYIWGTKIKIDKAVDAITGYTSITGLTVNALGAQANVLVGKLQMLIETGMGFGGEFFSMKDMVYADAKYFRMLPELLNECTSNKKSSLLGLMMQRFDVSDDFHEKIKESGFYKEPISKIIGNTSLFILYGMGEHLLHAQGMIAVLHNKKNKVLDNNGKEQNLIDAFYVEKDKNGVGTLKVKEGWTTKDGQAIDDEYIDKIKGKISYVNKSMHGAFGKDDKGMIHRYAVGRLIMNFRQWMPAHYSRRFRGRHYDADLKQYREGYYVSLYKFVRDLSKDACNRKLQIATRWNELKPDQKENMKRCFAETMIFAMLIAACALAGDPKDHKGNWARRHLIYQLKRMQMETAASTPIAMYGFISNGLKVLNSPMACISTLEKIAKLLKLTDIFVTIENGKHKGENQYVRNIETSLPFYGQIVRMLEMGYESDLFMIYN